MKYKNTPAAPAAPHAATAHAGRYMPKHMGINATAAPATELSKTRVKTRLFAPKRKHISSAPPVPAAKSKRYSVHVRI